MEIVLADTVFAPIGGFQAVTNAVEALAEDLGVMIEYGKTVTSVEASGVHVRDTINDSDDGIRNEEGSMFIPADLVIVNADLPYATKSLLPTRSNGSSATSVSATALTQPRFDWDESFDYSSGVISFHWSVNQVLDDLNTHNVFMVAESRANAEQSWNVLRKGKNNGKDREENAELDPNSPFNFYVHRASKTDQTAAPEGCDSIMVLVPCKTLIRREDCSALPKYEAMELYREQFDETIVSRARQAVFQRMAAIPSLQNLREHIVHEVVDTPASYADYYNLAAGTPFALVR